MFVLNTGYRPFIVRFRRAFSPRNLSPCAAGRTRPRTTGWSSGTGPAPLGEKVLRHVAPEDVTAVRRESHDWSAAPSQAMRVLFTIFTQAEITVGLFGQHVFGPSGRAWVRHPFGGATANVKVVPDHDLGCIAVSRNTVFPLVPWSSYQTALKNSRAKEQFTGIGTTLPEVPVVEASCRGA